jgi:dTDP-4-dehydrorhamnose reductase
MDWLRERAGLYHLAGAGSASRFEWAQLILEMDSSAEAPIEGRIKPAKSGESPTPARRPGFSALDCRRFHKAFGFQLPEWRDALRLAMSG